MVGGVGFGVVNFGLNVCGLRLFGGGGGVFVVFGIRRWLVGYCGIVVVFLGFVNR